MAVERKDEVLDKALETDTAAIPRYDVVLPSGEVVAENATIILKNPILQEGMPINKETMNECLAASGITKGTPTKYTLYQPGFTLVDGAVIRLRLHVESGATPTLNINNSGDKPLMLTKNRPMRAGTPSGLWMTVIYSSILDFFVLQGSSSFEDVRKFGSSRDIGKISSYEMFMVGRGDPTYSRNF